MTNEDDQIGLSPTVSLVIDQFVARLRADAGIDGDAIDRLEKLLRNPSIPKLDEINKALFEGSSDGETCVTGLFLCTHF